MASKSDDYYNGLDAGWREADFCWYGMYISGLLSGVIFGLGIATLIIAGIV